MKSSPVADSFRLGLGTALKRAQEPWHRCLILSDPQKNGGYIVLVRITTDDGRWPDRDCRLTPAEWAESNHTSTVACSTAMCGRAEAALMQAVRAGEFEIISSPSPEVLRKVIAAGRAAEAMPPMAQRLLAHI